VRDLAVLVGDVYDLGRDVRNRSSTDPGLSMSAKAQRERGKADREMNESILPKRSGSRPRTTPTNPHTQLEQNPERGEVVEELARRVFSLPGVEESPSAISVPGARALWLRENVPAGPPEAFMIGREFAHIHPMPDGSLHAALPPQVTQEAVEKGWVEQHPVARMGYIPQNVVMIYAPRDAEEIEVVAGLVVEAYRYAGGTAPGSG
jgi:Family of unknown function (DUF5519)